MYKVSEKYQDIPPRRGHGKWKHFLVFAVLVLFYFLTFGNILGIRFAEKGGQKQPQDNPVAIKVGVGEQDNGLDGQNPTQDTPVVSEVAIQEGDKSLDEISFVQTNFQTLEQTSSELIRYVRARYITPPPPPEKPLNLKYPKYQKSGLGKWIRNFYKDKRNGTFLEAGANNGESSHTIELEIELGWSGVLVECNPRVTPDLRNVGRKAWLATVCLSTNGYPQVINMSIPDKWTQSARLGPSWDLNTFGINSTWSSLDGIETVPLYPILASVGIKEIDYFSFDIEGAEFSVLKTFPFDKVLIKVLILEVYFYSAVEKSKLKNFLRPNGLVFIRDIEMDQIYVHESLLVGNVTVEELAKI